MVFQELRSRLRDQNVNTAFDGVQRDGVMGSYIR